MKRPRKEHMTNREVADLVGLTHSTISKYRSGTRTPSLDVMVKISGALDWPLEDQITAVLEDVYAPYLEGQIAQYATR